MFNRFFIIFLIIFLFSSHLPSAQESYGNIADYLNNIYNIDDNAGLTAFPVLNIPMGGRAEGMAMAFAAVANDISFIEYNPAGSAMLSTSEFAFFHNNWIADTRIEGLAFGTNIKKLGLAAGLKWLYTPFTEYNLYGDRVSSGYYSEGVATLNISYNFLSGFYFSGLSVGLNIKGAFRIMPDFTDDWENIIEKSGSAQSAFMGMADVGFLTRFNLAKFYVSREKNASAAVVLKNLGPPVLGEGLPTAINAAISYKPIRPLIIALDFNLPFNFADISFSEKPNASLGVSADITKFLSMHAGFMYRAGSSRMAIGSTINFDRVVLDVNYTLDLLTQMQPLNRISLGVRIDLGDGGKKYNSEIAEEYYLLGLEAYALGKIAEARLCWQQALRYYADFDPAKESLAMLEGREALVNRVDELQSLDF